ncbi:vacuolar protein sorting-associated protein [Anaeramoeba flamelloides]|uniref:Vacuolar protein sorting-associated protein n=1 Tax=Anaeramoeba flamelloides TaxID=1746091 RepID=A0ABQ8Y6J6_9EUKA|nr:vacuolar protein sorting-associated protein [Anaeramoeba flamelloides]
MGCAFLGTSNGTIYYAKFKNKNISIHKVYKFENQIVLTGIHYQLLSSNEKTHCILVTTFNTLYEFVGGPTIEQMFQSYQNTPIQFMELPGDFDFSELHVNNKPNFKGNFCFFNEAGIFKGQISLSKKNIKAGDKITENEKLIHFPDKLPQSQTFFNFSKKEDQNEENKFPIAMAQTNFHFLLAYPDKIIGMSSLDGQVVFLEKIDTAKDGKLIGFAIDQIKDSIWLFSNKRLFAIYTQEEDRDVWKIYIQKKEFETALLYCGDDKKKRDKVFRAHAKYLFHEKKYIKSATYFAKTNLPFEDVALKFLELESKKPLKTFLNYKIDVLSEKTHKQQRTLICMWLLELFLTEINYNINNEMNEEYKKVQEELYSFFEDHYLDLNPKISFQIFISYGRFEEMYHYSKKINDFGVVLSHQFMEQHYESAIKLLRKQKELHIIYHFSPLFITKSPLELIKCWKDNTALDPNKLLPALMRYKPEYNPRGIKENLAIDYLEFCVMVKKCEEPSIHNYLIYLYVRNNKDRELLKMLNPLDGEKLYNQRYALRLCMTAKKMQPSVFLYSEMGLYKQAVKLALTFDLKLAKIHAQKPRKEELRKKLTNIVAKYIAKKKKDLQGAITYLKQNSQIQIQNILPLFPDFDCIDDFKEEISNTLKSLNNQILGLKEEMKEEQVSSDLIRNDLNRLSKRSISMSVDETCKICNRNVLGTRYYLFPCKHCFHNTCLEKEMKEHFLTKNQINRMGNIKECIRIEQEEHQNIQMIPDLSDLEMRNLRLIRENLNHYQREFDEILAKSCPICGKLLSKIIEEPFYNLKDKELNNSWEL